MPEIKLNLTPEQITEFDRMFTRPATEPNRSTAVRMIVKSYIKHLKEARERKEWLESPRNPNNEIHLVLEPFEAAALLRAIMTCQDKVSSACRPIIKVLQECGVEPASMTEILCEKLETPNVQS